MIRVKLHGGLKPLLKDTRAQRLGLDLRVANGRELLSGIGLHAPGFRDKLNEFPCSIYVGGKSLKDCRRLDAGTLAGTALAVLAERKGKRVYIHFVPEIGGSAQAIVAAIVNVIVNAVIAYAVGKLVDAIFPAEEDKNSTSSRRNTLFESSMMTSREGLPFFIAMGRRVRVSQNFIETDVSIQNGRYGGTTFVPGAAALLLGWMGFGHLVDDLLAQQQQDSGWDEYSNSISGSKGGGSGGRTIANTEISEATIMGLGVYSSGPTGGIRGASIAEKEQNIYVNGVRLRGLNGVRSHPDAFWIERMGYPDQTATGITKGLPRIIQDFTTREFKKTDIHGAEESIIEQVRNADSKFIQLTLGFALVDSQNKNGDQRPANISFSVDVRANDAQQWQRMGTYAFAEKSTDIFQRGYIIPAPADAVEGVPWEFKVYRNTPDSTDDKLVQRTVMYPWVEYQKKDLTYGGDDSFPAAAMIGWGGNLASFGDNTQPEWTADVYGYLCEIPTPMDPETGVFATSGPGIVGGEWDGTFKLEPTDDPVWIWRALATMVNGAQYPDEPADSWFDRYELYEISKFNNQKIKGKKRFTFNKQFTEAKEARSVLKEVAASFSARMYETGDQLLLVQDRPGQPVRRYINNNHVLGGTFSYSETELADQSNVIEMGYVDYDNDARISYVTYEDTASIQRLKNVAPEGGRITRRMIKDGCIDKDEAVYFARVLGFKTQHEKKLVEFTTLGNGLTYFPGEIIGIQDSHVNGGDPNSRVHSSLGVNTLKLDAPLTFKANKSYDLWAMRNDELVRLPIGVFPTQTTTDTITVVGHGLSSGCLAGVVCVDEVQPALFSIMNIKDKGDGTFIVQGMQHFEGKWAWVEGLPDVPVEPWTTYERAAPTPTGPLRINDESRVHPVLGTTTTIYLSWDAYVGAAGVRGYFLEFKEPNGQWRQLYRGPDTKAELQLAVNGVYQFSLKYVTVDQNTGAPFVQQYEVVYGGDDPSLPLIENVAVA